MRFAVYLCVFGVLGGCHAFIDPEDDYLRPEDAGTPPMEDGGAPLDVFDAGPPVVDGGPPMADAGPPMADAGPMNDVGPMIDVGAPLECTNTMEANAINMMMEPPVPPCCKTAIDCPMGGSGFICINSACTGPASEQHAGVCIRIPDPLTVDGQCLRNEQCASGICSQELDEETVECGALPMAMGVCE